MTRQWLLLAMCWCILAGPVAAADRTRVAILPLDTPANQPGLKQYGTGTMDTLIQVLTTLPQFQMIDRARIENVIREQQFAQTGMVDAKSGVAVGKLLGAQVLVSGNLNNAGDKVRITAHFTDMKTGQITKSEVVTGPIATIFDLMDQLAQKFVAGQGVQVTAQQQQRMEKVVKSTASLSAYDYYLKGRQAFLLTTPAGYAEAIDWYKKAVATDPNYALAYAGLGEAYAYWGWQKKWNGEPNKDDYQQAYTFSQKAVSINPELAEAYRALGAAAGVLEEGDAYEAAIRKALELNPNDAQSWYEMWYAGGNVHDPEHADIRKALELNPDLVPARIDRGLSYYQAEKLPQAAAEFRKAIALSPASAEAHNGLGDVLFDQQQYKEAQAEYQQALKSYPTSVDAHNGLGWCYYELEQYDQALAEFQAALRVYPTSDTVTLHYGLGLVYGELERWQDCVKALEATLKLDPKHQGARELLGKARSHLKHS